MNTMIGVLGVILGLAAIMILIWKGFNIIAASLAASAVVCIFSGLNMDALSSAWLAGAGGYISGQFLLFALSALFGKLMETSGAAAAIADLLYKYLGAKNAIYGAMIATMIMVYGGISGFVVIFCVYPIFLSCLRKSNLPRYLLPGLIFGSVCTFAGIAPGAATVANFIPIQYLGTTATAAPVLGMIASAACVIFMYIYWEHEFKTCRLKQRFFDPTPEIEATIARFESKSQNNTHQFLAFVPIIVLLLALNVFKVNVYLALLIGSAVCMLMYWKRIDKKVEAISDGLASSVGPAVNTAAAVAFGSVIKSTAAFTVICTAVTSFLPAMPLISLGLSSSVLCGIMGSGSGGMAIVLEALAPTYLEMGVNPEVIHRIVAIAAVGLDSLPHCGLVTTMITYCGMTHKKAYRPIFMVSVICTLAMLVVSIIAGTIMYPI